MTATELDTAAGAESAPALAESAPVAAAETAPAETIELYKGHLQRLQAEFDNYRKRIAREKAVWNAQARGGVVEKLFPVMDNFGFALLMPALSGDVKVGLEMIMKQFREVLAGEGVEEVPGAGARFDARWHEAVEAVPDAAPEGTILAVRRSGWKMGERLLRAALVTVSSGPAKNG